MRKTLLALLLVCATSARAEVLSLDVGERTLPPAGWITLCQGSPAECVGPRTVPSRIVLTPEVWDKMWRVNVTVNNDIRPKTDFEHWGVGDRWGYPNDGYGDCEDYVLLKRRMLREAGFPSQSLLITVVKDVDGAGHAVLTVTTDKGEFVLDNQNKVIVLWHETRYKFVKRQSQSHPNVWVALSDPRHPLFTGGH